MSGLVLILAVIILSGLIAYLGDKVGMKVGKKRLTLLGLRPRYTSIIITVLTGILIATVSITLVLLPSRGARMVLLNMQRAITELENLQQRVDEQDSLLKAKEAQLASLNKELETISKQKTEMQNELKQKIEYYNQIQKEMKEEIARLENKKGQLEEKIASLESNIQELIEEKEQVTKVAKMFLGSALGDIVYRKGDVIFSRVIQGGNFTQETEVFEEIDRFLLAAVEKIKVEAGVEKEDINFIFDYYQLAQTLWQQDRPFILRVLALQNTAKGEGIMAYLEYMENRIVFKKGDIIAQVIIPGAVDVDSEKGISQLEGFMETLLRNVNQNAIKAGIIPSSSGKVGSFEFSEFYRVVSSITRASGPVVIKVEAIEDIWRDDSLVDNIRFIVEPLAE